MLLKEHSPRTVIQQERITLSIIGVLSH